MPTSTKTPTTTTKTAAKATTATRTPRAPRTTSTASKTATARAARTASTASSAAKTPRAPRAAGTTGGTSGSKGFTEADGVAIRSNIDSGRRVFQYSKEVTDTLEKHFVNLDRDIKLYRFATDSVGVVGDCYIIYAVAVLGACQMNAICSFLHSMKQRDPELSIPDMTVTDNVQRRLTTLVKCGFIFRHQYAITVDPEAKDEEDRITHVTLYSVTDDGIQLVNQKLGKHLTSNIWFQAKPISELMGWAASSFVLTAVAAQQGFHEFQQGVFRTRAIGTIIMPALVKTDLNTKKDHPGYIGFMPAFLVHNKSIQTDNDYRDSCFRFVSSIAQFFYSNDLKQRYARMVVVVQDNDDLVNAASWIQKDGTLKEDYDRIFFTGEGALTATGKLDGNFLRLMADPKDPSGFSIIPAEPDFIRKA